MGDIHGKWDAFQTLWKKIGFQSGKDMIVFLGDYIDRGEKPIHVLNWMREHYGQPGMVMLRGNHEQMMLECYTSSAGENSRGEDSIWLCNGGDKTQQDLQGQPPGTLEHCLAFLQELPLWHRMEIQGKDYIFCHAGLRPGIPLEKQKADDLLWMRKRFYCAYEGESTVVIGHTPMLYLGRPPMPWVMKDRNIIMMDTGAYLEEGCISCMDLISEKVWQSK